MGMVLESKHGVALLTVPTVVKFKTEYIGTASGQAIVGANFVRDFFARITDVLGGRSRSYEKPLESAIEAALDDMAKAAKAAGANAVIDISIDTCSIGQSMLMCSVAGTAVVLTETAP